MQMELIQEYHMGVSKNNGTPKWMVKIMENPIKLDDLGGNTPYFWVDTHISSVENHPISISASI